MTVKYEGGIVITNKGFYFFEADPKELEKLALSEIMKPKDHKCKGGYKGCPICKERRKVSR